MEYATTQSDDERTQKRFIEGRKFISKLRNAAKRMNKKMQGSSAQTSDTVLILKEGIDFKITHQTRLTYYR